MAITVDPNNALAYFSKGCFLDVQKDYDSALINYNKAISIDPTHINAHLNKAMLLDK